MKAPGEVKGPDVRPPGEVKVPDVRPPGEVKVPGEDVASKLGGEAERAKSGLSVPKPEGQGLVSDAKDLVADPGAKAAQEAASAGAAGMQAGIIAGTGAAEVVPAIGVVQSAKDAAAEVGQAKGIKDEIAAKADGAKKAADEAVKKDEDSADIEE